MSLKCALAPFTLKGFYLLTWGTALGTNVFHSISSVAQYKNLDSATFSRLQASLQPLYFTTSSVLTTALLGAHLYFHPVLLRTASWWKIEEGMQGLLILGSALPQIVNLLCVGPAAAKCSAQRADIQKLEGKGAPSQELQSANQRFSYLHGLATALNNTSLLALAGLGLAVSM